MAEYDEDREGQAAEYVLGTLDATERLDAEGRRLTDPAFDAAIRVHERRLSPLLTAVDPVEPPARLEARVMTAIDAATTAGVADVVTLKRRIRVWQSTAAAFATAAAALALVFVVPHAPASKGSFVAVLQATGVEPAYVASVDLDAGTVSVRRVGAPVTEAKSHELWILGGGRPTPVSLGVLDASEKIPVARLGSIDHAHLDTAAFAVTLEPPGGSPTGAPTGPVLWVGKLTPTD